MDKSRVGKELNEEFESEGSTFVNGVAKEESTKTSLGGCVGQQTNKVRAGGEVKRLKVSECDRWTI